MKLRHLVLACFTVLAVVTTSASVASADEIVGYLSTDTGLVPISGELQTSGDLAGRYIVDQTIESEEFSVVIEGLLDPDPSISYGLSVVDFGAPSAFSFLFTTPIVPTGAPTVVRSSIVGGLTDFSGDGVSITPTAGDIDGDGIFEIQVNDTGLPATNMGVDVGPAVAFGPGAAGSFYNYGPFATGPQPGPGAGPYTVLSSSVAFRLSGGGDVAVLTGFAEILTVPEPSTIVMGLMAGLGLVALRRRRNS